MPIYWTGDDDRDPLTEPDPPPCESCGAGHDDPCLPECGCRYCRLRDLKKLDVAPEGGVMGWYKQACSQCWDSHNGKTCEEYQRERAHWQAVNEQQRLLREQNDLLRQQNALLEKRGTK